MFIYTFLLLVMMKKKRNIGFVYFLAFTFLVLCVLGGLGFYGGNFITTAATIDAGPISDAIEGVLAILFTGFLAPLTKIFGGDDYQVAVRLVLGIVLYVLISFGIGKKFDRQEGAQGGNKNGRIISLVIAILGASLMPSAVIEKLFNPTSSIFGNFLGWILVFVIIVLPIYLLAKTPAQNRMGHFFKGAVYLILILMVTYIWGSFEDLLKTGGIFDLAYGLAVIWCLGGFIYHLYQAAANAAGAVGENVMRSGGIRGQLPRAGRAIRNAWRGRPQQGPQQGQQGQGDIVRRVRVSLLNAQRYANNILRRTPNNYDARELGKFQGSLKRLVAILSSIASQMNYDMGNLTTAHNVLIGNGILNQAIQARRNGQAVPSNINQQLRGSVGVVSNELNLLNRRLP